MKIGPLFKWFGSKWQSAKHYPAPEHSRVIEPFAGGAGYSLNHVDRQIVIWEEDPNLCELWAWLIDTANEKLIREIPVGLPVNSDIRKVGLSRGQALLLKHWQRTNNVGDCWTVSPWGHLPGQWTKSTRDRVSEEVSAIKHWKLIDPYRFIDVPATWFLDPPYQYNYRYRRGLPPFDYGALDSLVQTIHRDSMVIVCEAVGRAGEIPKYLPFKASHASVTSRRKATQSHHSKELVYIRSSLKRKELRQ